MHAATLDSQGYVTDVAYLPGYYPYMAPDRMRYVASLHGIAPPTVRDGFRYLELGCGFGGTLLTLAAANPQAAFTGIDFMPVHTEHMEREATASGLANVRVVCADFAALPDDLGTFDFITLHGVYSWISPELRRQVLRIIAGHLAPGGLVEVTYNAFPGWSSLLPVRSLIRHFAARCGGDSTERVRGALAELEELRRADIPLFRDHPLAAQLADRLRTADPRYVAHEYLNEHWTVFHAADVIDDFAGIGLGFAGRLPYHRNHVSLSAAPRFLPQFDGLDTSAVETLKDLHDNTMFRWDLFSGSARREWSPRERAAAADDLCFRAASASASLPHTVTYGTITAGIAGPPHDLLLDVMGHRGWTLAKLLDEPALRGIPPEALVEAVDAAVAMGLFRVDGGPVVDPLPPPGRIEAATLDVPLPFNRRAIANEDLKNATVGLASPRTGAGKDVGDLHAMILDEHVAHGRDGLESRLAGRLERLGKHLREHATGRPLESDAERRHAIGQIVADFNRSVLPELLRLGIATTAG